MADQVDAGDLDGRLAMERLSLGHTNAAIPPGSGSGAVPAAGGLHPFLFVKVVTDGDDTDYRVFKDTNAMSMDAEDVIMSLSTHALFGSMFENVKKARCKVAVVISSSKKKPTPEEEGTANSMEGAETLRDFIKPGMNLFVRVWLPPAPSPADSHGAGDLPACASVQPTDMQDDAYFDTCHLLKLRALVQHAAFPDVVLPATADSCRKAAAAYKRLGPQPSGDGRKQEHDAEEVVAIFRTVWSSMSLLPLCHPLYLPPIYQSTGMDQLLMRLVMAFRARETRDDRFDTGHFIIGGVEGTGKTTLVKAFAIGIAVCSTRYLLVYVDANTKVPAQNLTPSYIMAELVARHASGSPSSAATSVEAATSDFSGVFGMLHASDNATGCKYLGQLVRRDINVLAATLRQRFGFRVGIVVDEIQEVVVGGAAPDDQRVLLLRELHHFARQHLSALLVLTGSSASLRSRLFAKDRPAAFNNYSDFNKSLCSYVHVSALRTVDELRPYLAKRYSADVVPNNANSVLHRTGGIGRLVHQNVHMPSADLPRAKHPLDEFRATSRSFFVVPQLIRRYQSTLEPRHLERFIHALGHQAAAMPPDEGAAAPVDTALTSYLVPESTGMPHTALCEAMRAEHGFVDPAGAIESWVDDGLLYLDFRGDGSVNVQLARPADAEYYYSPQITADDMLRLHSVYLLVHRPELGVNAGTALELLMLPRIHSLLRWPHTRDGLLVVGANGCVSVLDANGTDHAINAGNITAVLGDRTLRWQKELGLDAVRVQISTQAVSARGDGAVASPTMALTLSGWQCKGGKQDGNLAGGDVATYTKIKPTHSDDSLPSIVARAEQGFMRLAAAFRRAVPGICVRLETLIVTTTKSDCQNALEFLRSHRSLEISLTAHHAKQELGNLNMMGCSFKYSLELHTGTSWMLNCLEPALRKMWPVAPV